MNKNYLMIAIVAAVVLIPILVVLSISFSGDNANESLSLFDADYQRPTSETLAEDNPQEQYRRETSEHQQYPYQTDNATEYQSDYQADNQREQDPNRLGDSYAGEQYANLPFYTESQGNASRDSQSKSSTLIETFTIITPNNSKLCSSANPWSSGYKQLDKSAILTDNSCFAFRLSSSKTAEIFLVSQSESGKLVKIFPNNCNGLGSQNSKLAHGKHIILPQDELGQYFVLAVDEETGTEWFYSIAVSNDNSRNKLYALLQKIPDICDTNASYSANVMQFQAQLDTLQHQNRDNFDWRLQDVSH